MFKILVFVTTQRQFGSVVGVCRAQLWSHYVEEKEGQCLWTLRPFSGQVCLLSPSVLSCFGSHWGVEGECLLSFFWCWLNPFFHMMAPQLTWGFVSAPGHVAGIALSRWPTSARWLHRTQTRKPKSGSLVWSTQTWGPFGLFFPPFYGCRHITVYSLTAQMP